MRPHIGHGLLPLLLLLLQLQLLSLLLLLLLPCLLRVSGDSPAAATEPSWLEPAAISVLSESSACGDAVEWGEA